MSDLEIRAKCTCGMGLAIAIQETDCLSNVLTITLQPCLDCTNEKYDEGFEDGQDSLDDDGIDP